MTIEKKPFYKSKTKIGILLIAVGPVLATVGGMLVGSIDLGAGITALSIEVGIVLAALGIRDWNIINRVR